MSNIRSRLDRLEKLAADFGPDEAEHVRQREDQEMERMDPPVAVHSDRRLRAVYGLTAIRRVMGSAAVPDVL